MRVAGDPAGYELWYTYAVGRDPNLNRRINRALDENGSLSISELDGIYDEFIGSSRTEFEFKDIDTNVSGEIHKVVRMISE